MSDELYAHLIEALDRNSDALVRNSDAFARNSDAFARNSEAFDRNSAALDRNAAGFDATQRFFAALTDRHERATRRMIAEIDDQRDLIRKQTQGLMRILDRLDDSGSQAAT